MKIVICGSMTAVKKMVELRDALEKLNHEITLPRFTEDYAKIDSLEEIHSESVQNKINHDLIRNYFTKISEADSVLIINEAKNDITNYIGGNTFLEIAFAHVLNKKIFLLNPIPELSYADEIIAMQPIIINNNLDLIN